MDSSLYKETTVSRGLVYRYFSSPARDSDKPTLLFLHGFPSASQDWEPQVVFFQAHGYGLIVPDMLGYGGTAKPMEPEAHAPFLMCKDIVDILDAEKVDSVIVVGHDLGATTTSRLADLYPDSDRFVAFAFLALGYYPIRRENDYEAVMEQTRAVLGYGLIGYWTFFAEADAPGIIEGNLDSFFALVYAKDPALWATDLAPLDAFKQWILDGRTTPVADFITAEDLETFKKTIRDNGIAAPLIWYKVYMAGIDVEDAKAISAESREVKKPTFLGTAEQDRICLAPMQVEIMKKFCPNHVIRRYDAGHWMPIECQDQVNTDLLEWIEGL
ncbi:alpha/beta-hydrolase [Hymenopellis radicata]|nr:alpha/beta-hydrolase [Hymenopellis radicata]